VCGSAHGSVRQCEQQCVGVRTVVCGSVQLCGSAAVCSCAVVRQCAAMRVEVRAAVRAAVHAHGMLGSECRYIKVHIVW
jgi:hypothetical protein